MFKMSFSVPYGCAGDTHQYLLYIYLQDGLSHLSTFTSLKTKLNVVNPHGTTTLKIQVQENKPHFREDSTNVNYTHVLFKDILATPNQQ